MQLSDVSSVVVGIYQATSSFLVAVLLQGNPSQRGIQKLTDSTR